MSYFCCCKTSAEQGVSGQTNLTFPQFFTKTCGFLAAAAGLDENSPPIIGRGDWTDLHSTGIQCRVRIAVVDHWVLDGWRNARTEMACPCFAEVLGHGRLG